MTSITVGKITVNETTVNNVVAAYFDAGRWMHTVSMRGGQYYAKRANLHKYGLEQKIGGPFATLDEAVAWCDTDYQEVRPEDGGGGPSALPPAILSLSPQSMEEGTASLDVTIYGSNFVDGCVAMLGAVSLPTVFNSPTNLTATLAFPEYNPSIYMISVTNPDAQVSAAKMFTIRPLPGEEEPVLESITPDTCAAGAAPFNVDAFGTGFVDGSLIYLDFAEQATTFVDEWTLSATLDVSAQTEGEHTIRVGNPSGEDSNTLPFTITAAIPFRIVGFLPDGVPAGYPDLSVDVLGEGFENGDVIVFGGVDQTTEFVTDHKLRFLCAVSTAVPGEVITTVRKPGGAETAQVAFTFFDEGTKGIKGAKGAKANANRR